MGRFKPGPTDMSIVDTKRGDEIVDRLDLGLYGAPGQLLQALNRLAAEIEELRSRTAWSSLPGGILFREHRGSHADSMATIVGVADMAALRAHLFETLRLPKGELAVKPYTRDERAPGWTDTHIVTIEGYGVVGFTSGMPS